MKNRLQRTLSALLLFAVLTSCGDGKEEASTSPADTGSQRTDASQPLGNEGGGDSTSNNGGGVGSSNGTQLPPSCLTDADCADEVGAYVARLSAAQPSGEPLVLISLSCSVESARQQTESCSCLFDDRVIGIEPCYGFKSDMDGVGRTTGLLLYREFPGCTPGDASSCDAPCAAVAGAIEQERQKAFDVEIRTVRCFENQCKAVARIEDSCYSGNLVRGGEMRGPFDCSLTDQEIATLEDRLADNSAYPDCFWQPTETGDGQN